MLDLAGHCLRAAALCVCSYYAGRVAQSALRLPAITGYIVTGCLAGPGGMNMLSSDGVAMLRTVEQACLSIIGFAAGCELLVRVLRAHARAVCLTLLVMLPSVFGLMWIVMGWFEQSCPLVARLPDGPRAAAKLLVCTILLARSPASALAVVKETHSRGKFTELALATSIALDTVVVSLYAFNSHIAHLLADGSEATVVQLAQPVAKLLCSAALGWVVAAVLGQLPSRSGPEREREEAAAHAQTGRRASSGGGLADASRARQRLAAIQQRLRVQLRAGLRGAIPLISTGAAVFYFSNHLRKEGYFLRIDALLTCVAAGAVSVNMPLPGAPPLRDGVSTPPRPLVVLADEVLPVTNVGFFALVGTGLSPRGVLEAGLVVGALWAARLLGLVVGAWGGAGLAGLTGDMHRYRWMAFVTQAGVALGLCKQAVLEFPDWGQAVYSIAAAVICCNLIVGPLCFKWVLHRSGEAGTEDASPRGGGGSDPRGAGDSPIQLAAQASSRAESWPDRPPGGTGHRSTSLRVPLQSPGGAQPKGDASVTVHVEELPAGSSRTRASTPHAAPPAVAL
eukprot:TRINITY_DN9048_c0_g1_i2.p1 TRINITY_DN9048_c0_g1~~TRINITY_DN9048_c0_g1_i2.p1  ORF type:complete len:565 (+),score=97.01 TRINITY_DN9048_c0_g1_i2:85-1779(+)